MGVLACGLLFRKSSRSRSGSAWANAHGVGQKKVYSESLTSQESMLPMDETISSSISSSPPSSANCATEHSQSAQLLELQLQHKDETIAQLHRTIEAGEKVHSERIDLLERQIEHLVELSSNQCALQGSETPGLKKTRSTQVKANIEVSSLHELLSRVVAEKDRLICENANIKSLLKQLNSQTCHSSSTASGKSNMPATIDRLDRMINTNCKTKQLQDNNYLEETCNEDEEGEQLDMLYQLSCHMCRNDHSHFKYMGAFTTTPTETMKDLREILKLHFAQVSKMVQQQEGSISSSVHGEEWSKQESGDFPSSSFARHLAKHCQSLSNEGDVLKWCEKNVKVELQRDGPGDESNENRTSSQQETKRWQRRTSKK